MRGKIKWTADWRGDGANGVDRQGGAYTIRVYRDSLHRRAFQATEPDGNIKSDLRSLAEAKGYCERGAPS